MVSVLQGTHLTLLTALSLHSAMTQAAGIDQTRETAVSCFGHRLSIKTNTGCDWEAIVKALDKELSKKHPDCPHDASTELRLLMESNTTDTAKSTVDQACRTAWASVPTAPFTDTMTNSGELFHTIPSPSSFAQTFFDGGTYWNEERQTVRMGEKVSVLAEDPGEHIRTVHDLVFAKRGMSWPGDLNNFATCEMQAAMCCWVQDRQANDKNGNCAEPYDGKCINGKPGNNGDICYVDMKRSVPSNHVNGGFAIFGGKEGRTHCHGWAWDDDENAFSNRYKGNTLFMVSIYDHLQRRGYVRNIPGAPMCACLENMPTVTRADCTELRVRQTTEWTFGDKTVSVKLHDDAKIGAGACQAEQNNDFKSFYEKMKTTGRIKSKKAQSTFDKYVVGKEQGCSKAIETFMAQQGWSATKFDTETYKDIHM